MEFDWDEWNCKHIARHGVTPEEAEEALTLQPMELEVQDDVEPRLLCLGKTRFGRLLTVVYTERNNRIRVVTAYDMAAFLQMIYFGGR